MLRTAVTFETAVRTAAGVVLLPATFLVCSAIALALSALGVPPRRLHRVYTACAWVCLRVGGTRLQITGTRHLEPGRAYVVVANHESMWDAPCAVAGLSQLTLRFIAKSSIMRIPVFGPALRRTGNVSVVRTETGSDVNRIREGMEQRAPDVSVLFFAEGTRSRDGALHPFKMGAFATALAARLPILPVAIAGTYAIWPKGILRLRRGPVVLAVGEPISVEGLAFDDRAALRDQVHHIVSRLRAQARRAVRAGGHDPGGLD